MSVDRADEPESLREARRERHARELLQAVVAISSGPIAERDAFERTLAEVCRHMEWPVGHVYMRAPGPEHGGPLLVSTGIWYLADRRRFSNLVRITEETTLPEGVGMPGRVLQMGRPLWVMDVTRDPNFPRARAAVELGVGAGFGFPVIAHGRVHAVLEFFAGVAVEPDEPLLDVMASVGLQLGRVIERRRDHDAMLASELRFRSVIQSATDAIITTDAGGNILDWNHGAEVIFGHRAIEAVGRPLELIIPERFQAAHRAGMKRHRATGEARVIGRTVELFGVRKSGDEFPLELSLASWRVGNDYFFGAIIRDISERRRAEERLARSHQQAQQIFAALAEVLPGAELDGKYRLEQQIGVGGFGVVYRAMHLSLARPVAVKVFRPTGERITPEHLARFKNEGVSACRVQHPNAVQVLDSGVSAGGIPYLVMELLEGETLAELLRRHDHLPLGAAMVILADVAEVLAVAHATGLVHRDIKPENVFLHAGREGRIVKVLDFGIAKLVGVTGPVDTPQLTGTGQMIGTPAYMSPERLRGDAHDGRADVYSLGVMAYELLAGKPPFWSQGNNAWAVVKAHLDHAPEPLSALVPEAPAELSELAARCLAKRPDDRPDAAEVAAALRALVAAGIPGATGRRERPTPLGAAERTTPPSTPLAVTVEDEPAPPTKH